MPTFGLSTRFGFFVIISSITQYACTLIPEVGGRKTQYHRLLAGVSAVLLVPAQMLLLFASTIDTTQKVVTGISVCLMLAIIFLIALNNGRHRYFLLLQSLYFGAFFAPILFIAYL